MCGVAVTCKTPTAAARVWLTVRLISPAPEPQFRALLQSPAFYSNRRKQCCRVLHP